MEISVRADLKPLTKALYGLERDQIPFATAKTLTAVAGLVKAGERAAFGTTFDSPTPFTMNAVGVIAARKSNQTATVFVKDIQAVYLAPFEFGGSQVLGNKRAILTPRDVATNKYGNIPKGKLAALKGRPDVFIGEVKFKSGKVIAGVWQRSATKRGKQRGRRGKYGTKGKLNDYGVGQLTSLKLLIQFTKPSPVTHHLDYLKRAKSIVDANLGPEWNKAIAAAIASAK